MTFGEKLYKLRKEKGLSQEALAEQVNTTRQAISKWENNQGFPETEKLMIISNIFEVSIDYLLKDSEEPPHSSIDGYYVSREKAEAWILHEKTIARKIAIGIGLILCSGIPFFLLGKDTVAGLIGGTICLVIGIGIILATCLSDHDFEYKALKQNSLIFDHNYLEELKNRYACLRKKYIGMIVGFLIVILLGGVIFYVSIEFYHVAESTAIPVFLPFIALGLGVLVYSFSVMDAYEILVYNEEHMNKFSTRLLNKIRNLFNRHS